MDGLAQRGVRVDRRGNLVVRGLGGHREADLGDEFRGLGADDVRAEDLADPALLRESRDALHAALIASGRVGAEVLGLTGGAIPVGGMLTPCGLLGETLALLAGDAAGLTNPVTGADTRTSLEC